MIIIFVILISVTSAADVDFDPFATAAKLNASLHACYKNHRTEYPDREENRDVGVCPYYFERDATEMYWCRDKSCAISNAIENHKYGRADNECTNPHDGYVAPDENAFYVRLCTISLIRQTHRLFKRIHQLNPTDRP
jgi:hypothetical protein